MQTLFEGELGEIRRVRLDYGYGLAYTMGDTQGLLTISRLAGVGDVEGNDIVGFQNDLRVAAGEAGVPIYRFKKLIDEQLEYEGLVYNVVRFTVFLGEQRRLPL
ncbi:MAG: hypothetical protein OCU12_07760 [Methanophagales archaeon]|nr:hypothetical protein [Methanophagales archaeon]